MPGKSLQQPAPTQCSKLLGYEVYASLYASLVGGKGWACWPKLSLLQERAAARRVCAEAAARKAGQTRAV